VEVRIRELVEALAEACRFTGRIRWDATKPDGQARRRVDASRAAETIGFSPEVSLQEGLRRTVAWWETQDR
jgi:GDP-L-fucose synthase